MTLRPYQTSLYLYPEVAMIIEPWSHLSRGAQLMELAQRYTRVMEFNLPDLTPVQWRAVLQAMELSVPFCGMVGTIKRMVVFHVRDWCRQRLDEPEYRALNDLADDWTPTEELAVLHAVERWWTEERRRDGKGKPPVLPKRRG